MPIFDTLVVEPTKQIIEPISSQISNRLLNFLGIKDIFADSIFLLSDDLAPSNFEDEDDNKRMQDNRCDITINPNYNPLETIFDVVSGISVEPHASSKRWIYGDFPMFSDPRANIYLFEVAVPCSVELKFALRVKSVELADTISTMLYSRYLNGGSVYDYNDIQYAYGIPDKVIMLLYRMYKMQDDIAGKVSFKDYLTIGSKAAITYLANRERPENQELIIQRSNTKVLGKLEYSGDKHETEDYNKVSNRYLIEFSYFFQFSKPSILRLSHPIMVYNQLVQGQYIHKTFQNNMEYGEGEQYFKEQALNNYFYERNKVRIDLSRSYPQVTYPYYDDWVRSPTMHANIINKYQPLFIGLMCVTVGIDGKCSLYIDLKNEIFPMMTPATVPEVTNVIQTLNLDRDFFQTYLDLFRRMGIFDIAVFSNDVLIPFERLSLDKDTLVLTVSGNVDITKLYRVVISQIKDITILNRLYIFYMLDHPDYYADFLALNMRYLLVNNFVKIVGDDITPLEDVVVNKWYNYPPYSSNLTPSVITIHHYKIIVNRNRY